MTAFCRLNTSIMLIPLMTPQPSCNNQDKNYAPNGGHGPQNAGPRGRSGGPGGRGGRGGRGRTPLGPRTPQHGSDGVPTDKEAAIELDGTVSAVLAGTMFRVKLRNGHEVLAHISGKMRKRFIRLVIGDQVRLEMSQYDADKARIVYRM